MKDITNEPSILCVCVSLRESLLAEMGVSIKEDGGTLGVFSPKGVSFCPSQMSFTS